MSDLALARVQQADAERRRPTVHPLTLTTWNVGRGRVSDLRGLVRDITPDVLALQEMSDRPGLIRVLEDLGYNVVATRRPGGPATPIAFHTDRLKVRHEWARTLVQSGAGPYIRKDKVLTGARARDRDARRPIVAANEHMPFRQSNKRQRRAAELMMDRSFTRLSKPNCPAFLLGDFNVKPGRVLHPAGWLCTQEIGQKRATHGKRWTPDQIWWAKHPAVELVSTHVTTGTKSDHRPYTAVFNIKELSR